LLCPERPGDFSADSDVELFGCHDETFHVGNCGVQRTAGCAPGSNCNRCGAVKGPADEATASVMGLRETKLLVQFNPASAASAMILPYQQADPEKRGGADTAEQDHENYPAGRGDFAFYLGGRRRPTEGALEADPWGRWGNLRSRECN